MVPEIGKHTVIKAAFWNEGRDGRKGTIDKRGRKKKENCYEGVAGDAKAKATQSPLTK